MPEPIVVDGRAYFTAADVAAQWGIKESTIKSYAKPSCGKLRGCIRHDGLFLVPADAIVPLAKSQAQGIIWLLVHFRIGNSSFLDLSSLDISNDVLKEVLLDLRRQNYIYFDGDDLGVRAILDKLWVTDKGFDLIEYRTCFTKNPIKQAITAQNIELALTGVQTILQVVQMGIR